MKNIKQKRIDFSFYNDYLKYINKQKQLLNYQKLYLSEGCIIMSHCFKKKLSKKLLGLSCALMLVATGASAMDDGSIQMGKGSHSKQSLFYGNMKAIESFRDFYRNHSDGSDTDKSLVEHQDVFTPFAQFLLQTMNKEAQNPSLYLEELQAEVNVAITKKRVSPDWLIDMHFRFLALDGMSESERDVFNHVPYHKYLDALLAKDIHGQPVVVDLYKWGTSIDREGEYFYEWGERDPYVQGVSEKAMKLIDKSIAQHLPAPIIYPSLDEGILPISLILRNWLKEIYHIGMPTKNIKNVHGEENTSKLGFAFHDLFHYKNDKRRLSFVHYIKNKVGEYVMSGKGFASDVIPQLVSLTAQKYILIMGALERAYLNVEGDNHAVAGFFALAHEVSPFSQKIFDISNPLDLIDALAKEGLSYYSQPDVWENPNDPLETSPNGDSSLSEERIKELAIDRLAEDATLNLPYQIYEKKDEEGKYIGYATEESEKTEIRKAWLPKNTRSEIKKTVQFIDVIFTFADEEEKIISYPTLNRKWKNVNASLGLLSFAGIHLDQPILNGENISGNRDIALHFIENVQGKLQGTVTDFAQKAKAVFGEGIGSYTEEYALKFKDLDEKILDLVGIG